MADKILIPTTQAALREQQSAHKAFEFFYESRYLVAGHGTLSNTNEFFLMFPGSKDTVIGLPDNFHGSIAITSALSVNDAAESGSDYEVGTVIVGNTGTVALVTAAGTDFGAGDDGIVIDLTTNDVRLDVQRVTNGLKIQAQGYTAASSEVTLAYAVVVIKGAVMVSGDNFINNFPAGTIT